MSNIAASDVSPNGKLQPVVDRRANRLLAALSPDDFALIGPHLDLVRLERADVLSEPGEDVVITHFPCRHTMVSLLVWADGEKALEVATIGREGAIGGIVSAGNKPAFGRAVVVVEGGAFSCRTDDLDAAKRRSPALTDLFDRYADALLAQVMQSAACNAAHTLEQRMCRWLLFAHDRAGEDAVRLTQEALAEMLGVQRTSVSGVVKALQARGVIASRRGRFVVLDRRGLERGACPCYRAVEDHFARLLPEVDAPRVEGTPAMTA